MLRTNQSQKSDDFQARIVDIQEKFWIQIPVTENYRHFRVFDAESFSKVMASHMYFLEVYYVIQSKNK